MNLRPRTVADFMAQAGEPVAACFLGYPDVSIDEKVAHVAGHVGPPSDWLNRTGEANTRRYLEVSRSLSRHLRDECSAAGLSFVDTGRDFHAGIENGERALMDMASGQHPFA